jgi:hypothetical protein
MVARTRIIDDNWLAPDFFVTFFSSVEEVVAGFPFGGVLKL